MKRSALITLAILILAVIAGTYYLTHKNQQQAPAASAPAENATATNAPAPAEEAAPA